VTFAEKPTAVCNRRVANRPRANVGVTTAITCVFTVTLRYDNAQVWSRRKGNHKELKSFRLHFSRPYFLHFLFVCFLFRSFTVLLSVLFLRGIPYNLLLGKIYQILRHTLFGSIILRNSSPMENLKMSCGTHNLYPVEFRMQYWKSG
jgi:hypothetical protein